MLLVLDVFSFTLHDGLAPYSAQFVRKLFAKTVCVREGFRSAHLGFPEARNIYCYNYFLRQFDGAPALEGFAQGLGRKLTHLTGEQTFSGGRTGMAAKADTLDSQGRSICENSRGATHREVAGMV
jgi:hypothetical protein